jgi:hypothetical protein
LEKQIAIVGNGPSRHLYTPFKGDVCLCNIPQIDVPYDYISIVDRKAADYISTKGLKFPVPILTTDECRKVINSTPAESVYKEKLMNSAATAAYYFSDSYDTIWLYGCDALWSDVTTSSQDELIPRAPRMKHLHKKWREFWTKVWATNKTFIIVCPKDTEEIDYGKNVIWNRSKT